ncbi:MAG: glycosyltransferase [Bacteroidales bacterium]|nr:MAG: glycosyltransferase [Bacteroidales bacterium]
MNILINASTVKYGGGLTVALNFIKAFTNLNSIHPAIIIAPRNVGFERFHSDGLILDTVPGILHLWIFRFFLDYIWIKQKIIQYKIDFVISLGNLPVPNYKKQALLFDNPFLTLASFNNIPLSITNKIKHKLRNFSFRRRLNNLALIFSQSKLQNNLLFKKFNYLPRTIIIPNSCTTLFDNSESKKIPVIREKNKIKLLAFSRYYEHKNLEILLDLASLFKKYNSKYIIYLTIKSNQGKGAGRILRSITKLQLNDYIKNLGEIAPFNLNFIYDQVDAVILPTLLESFSSVYVDALKFRKPIFTSNREFAKEVCGNAAFYFNPFSARDIYNTLESAFKNRTTITEKLNEGEKIISMHICWDDIVMKILKSIEDIY